MQNPRLIAFVLVSTLRAFAQHRAGRFALAVLVAAGVLLGAGDACGAPGQDLTDGRVRVFVGRPMGHPEIAPRRVMPSGRSPRGVTLVAARASTPRAWSQWELDQLRAFARRTHYLTWSTRPRGFDITPFVSGREYRVDPKILSAINVAAARGLTTCNVVSGWRDSAKQLALWLGWRAGLPGFNPANAPGTSLHEALPGLPARAADVYCGGGAAFFTWARQRGVNVRALGLVQRHSNEAWHVELAGVA
jgi:hypothetical protein